MARNDKTGWKRGAGPYSKNYAKFESPPEYVAYHNAGNSDHHHGRDVQGAVYERGYRNDGRSAEVSRGNRPAHKSGKKTGSGIDSPDSTAFKRGKDYR